MKNIKKFFNKIFKKNKLSIRDIAIENLCLAIEDYSDWYEEHGLHLPPDYATDPGEWNEVLHKMKRAFRLLYDEIHEEGDLWEAKNKWKDYGQKDTEEIERLYKEIAEGFTLFGSQLLYLTDYKKDVK
jgi:phosphatidylserine/phosphatidylglycerophosphate/cardiolipin synthase-like enzyme